MRLFLLLFISLPLSAEVYTWVDEQGKKHFSDKKPAHLKQVEKIEYKPHDSSVDQQKAKQQYQIKALLNEAEKKRQEEKRQQRKAQFELQKRHKLCEQAKNNLAIFDRTTATVIKNPDGTREYFTKEQRNQQRKKIVADKAKYCR